MIIEVFAISVVVAFLAGLLVGSKHNNAAKVNEDLTKLQNDWTDVLEDLHSSKTNPTSIS